MLNVDHFESYFRSAVKDVYHHQALSYSPALIVGDVPPAEAQAIADRTKSNLKGQNLGQSLEVKCLSSKDMRSVPKLMEAIDGEHPKLIVTWRNLFGDGWRYPYSLGQYVDVLTQVAKVPVLLLPHPKSEHALNGDSTIGKRVMAITDHLTGDESLIQNAVAMTASDGTLFLAHVEDESVFDRYIRTISRIPNLNTDIAREEIALQLMKEPRDYIQSCQEVLAKNGVQTKIETILEMGHFLEQYRHLIESHQIDLLVLNTKDEDQMAMHGLAHPLVVEMRHIPMLLL